MAGPDFPGLLVLDGGFGTELERRGCDVRGELWSAEALLGRPDLVEDVHAAYLEAGADCITTGSYQVSFEGFARAGLSTADTIRALKASMTIAEAARRRVVGTSSRRAFIAASLGPYGAILHNGAEYHGRYGVPAEALVAFHRSRLEHLQDGPIDLVACETVPSLEEATRDAPRALDLPAPPCVVGLHLRGRSPHRVWRRDRRVRARELGEHPQVIAIGVNCTAPALVGRLIECLKAETTKPIVVYPNSGQQWDADGRVWTGRSSTSDYGELAVEWHRRGARWLGGCCGTTPADIARMRAALTADPDSGLRRVR